MPSVTYTCSFDSALAFNAHPSASLSGPSSAIPSGARVTNVSFSVYCGVSTYNYDADCVATLTDSSGNTFAVDSTCNTGSDSRIWASWDESVSESESASMDWNNLDTVELSGTNKLTVRTGYTATLTIEYEEYTRCGAPTTVNVQNSQTTASTNVLSWSGASAGNNNAITGYYVQYSDSTDGKTWNGWAECGGISTSATSGSMTVDMPAAGTYRKWKVWTLGTASGYDSASGTESSAAYRIAYTACGAPTACAVNDTLSTGNVTLSWSGATAGTANAIKAYEIQYRDSSNGSTWGSWAALKKVTSTATSGSLSVSPPSTAGYYRQFRIRTQGAAGSAYYSAWKTSTNTLRRDHAALAGFTDSPLVAGTTPVKALHMTELQDRANTLRAFYGLSAYAFSPIDARGIAGWTEHVNEIKEAIEGVCTASGKKHEAWIAFSVNCPRADVMNQLRAVVLAL